MRAAGGLQHSGCTPAACARGPLPLPIATLHLALEAAETVGARLHNLSGCAFPQGNVHRIPAKMEICPEITALGKGDSTTLVVHLALSLITLSLEVLFCSLPPHLLATARAHSISKARFYMLQIQV